MKKLLFLISTVFVFGLLVSPVLAVQPTDKGFNDYGYNYSARIFSGLADGVDKKLDGMVWGSPTYANDRLVMKWNAEWDRGNDEGWTDPNGYDAWENNEWNGAVPNGSGEVWHYKIKWVGSTLEESPRWVEGGYPIWGQFEVIMDQGTVGGEHMWLTHGVPSGYNAH
ncbi:TPA: hypothetical protein DCP77_03995 [Candidatus Collierbacteria bacterium]|uniref:Uncharacterized protein n=1 Tax=Candidatus Collierbacteria bacterium GW2011_GWA2_42_17 TaxID=1618378 RepID=A0A0G1C1H1_9BACT|nr:MAG: hypothetical protein UU94_C0001G0017 [Candidatus Collierbacteria bacterium GW2011_GWB2_42_12]KKS43483.1 MAG: hypothetical protein UV06_C0001G0217 [Candidatus Collierbacteria bacterium GW2011_GWA2_42_17]KKS62086.1 MAG: hypothetical protein UV30_C0024G0015 [Candidatus Collierbacteria bacterium GW2011_GWF1_42_50]KKS62501.1 MAG: hypothetical protein UV28_C0010G0060 [Candidatus Collierbacteria bacterium GW2011_GWE2_42_48]KKS62783.1 MAG: hypothetical protein UV29_C0010G0018 [Candidatus Collie